MPTVTRRYMMVFKWNEQTTLLFLENFKKYPCLWNHKIDTYRDKQQREIAMISLIKDLHINKMTEEDIKRKVKTIRTRYTSELSRIRQSKNSGCSPEDVYVPTLYWFKHAEFLGDVCVPRPPGISSNVRIKIKTEHLPEDSPNEDCSEADQQFQETHSEFQYVQNISQLAVSDQMPINCRNEHQIAFFPGTPSKRKRANETPIEKVYLTAINEQNKVEQELQEDEFDLFCRSLAVQLKKMPLDRALICQEKLQSVMVQERLSHIRYTSPPRHEFIYSNSSTPSPDLA